MNRIEAQEALMADEQICPYQWNNKDDFVWRNGDGRILDKDEYDPDHDLNPFACNCTTEKWQIWKKEKPEPKPEYVDYPVTVKAGRRYEYDNRFMSAATSYENFIGYVYMVDGKEHVHSSCIVYLPQNGSSLYSIQVTGSEPIRPTAVRFRKDKDD